MTNYDIYRYIFIGAAILSGIMLVVSILVFILLKIPKVISDLSGATARKAIKNIREQNAASGDKGYKVSAFNQARGKLTDKISPSGNVIKQQQSQMAGVYTTKIETQELHTDEPANQTTVLGASNETSVLDSAGAGETSVLDNMGAGETSVLSSAAAPVSAGETSVLSESAPSANTAASLFTIEYDITYIHTNEVISTEAAV